MDGHTQGRLPFPLAWWSFDLGRYRECGGTYCRFEYDSLPPIPDASESLDWLEPLTSSMDEEMAMYRNPAEARGDVAKIVASAARLDLALPESFVRLMSDPELQNHIPSCTACYFQMSDDIMPCPGSDGGYIIRFLNDQQDVLLWYLYLTPDGAQYVLVTPIDLEEMAAKAVAGTFSDKDREDIQQNAWICAPSFVSFIYRWWLENSIWFKVSDDADFVDAGALTNAERTYLAHYDSGSAESETQERQ